MAFARSVCFYWPGAEVYLKNCQKFCSLVQRSFNDTCELEPLSQFTAYQAFGPYNYVYITGHGRPEGLYVDDATTIPWADVVKIRTRYLIIDTCYSGYADRVNPSAIQAKIVISASGKCLSVTGSLVEALVCFVDHAHCIAPTSAWCNPQDMFADFGLCQMYLGWKLVLHDRITGIYVLEPYKQFPVCIGTAQYLSATTGYKFVPFRW